MSFGPPPSVYTQSSLRAAGDRKKRRKRVLGGAAAVLAALLVGAWFLWPGSDGQEPAAAHGSAAGAAQGRLDVRETVEKPPANTTGVMAFRFSVDDLGAGEEDKMPGMWATDKILAKGIRSTLVGLMIGTDASPGDEKWRLRLSGPICGYTPHVTGDNRTAVLFRDTNDEDALCDHVAFVDLDGGQKLWEHKLPASVLGGSQGTPDDAGTQATPSVTLTHATVAVTWGGGSDAYDMDSGRRLWRTKAVGKCQDAGAAGGRALLVRQECWNRDATVESWKAITYKVRKVQPRTGRTRWTYTATSGIRDLRVPSTDPPVLVVAAGDTAYTELLSLDGRGENRATISLRNGFYTGECSDDLDYVLIDDCPTIAVGSGQAFLRSKESGGQHTSNWVIGFDLATGNTTEKFESGPNALLRPLRMSGDRLLALRESDDHISPSALVSLNPKTGKETPYYYFNVPSDAEALTLLDANDIVVQDGRLFFGARSATGPADGKKAWTWLVLGIESSAEKK